MGVFVSEHAGSNNYRQPITQGPLAQYLLSSTAGASSTLQSGTKFIRVSADAGCFLNNSTTSGSLSLTSTNSFRIPANAAPELISVSTAFKLQFAST